MTVNYNPGIVTNGLALNVDFANLKSYTPSATTALDIITNTSGNLVASAYYSYDATTKSINFTRDSASVIGGTFSITLSGALSSSSFLYNDHTMEVFARINDYAASNINANETDNRLMSYQGYHSGFSYAGAGFSYNIWNGVTSPAVSFATRPAASAWFHAVAVRSGSNTTVYLNGIFNASANFSTASGNPGVTSTLKFASGNPSPGPYAAFAKCNIAYGRLYTRALTAAEVLRNFNAVRGRYNL